MYIKRPMCLYAVAFVFIVSIFVKIFPLKHNNEILSAEDTIISIEGTLYSKDTKNGKLRLYIRNAESEICDDLGFIAEVSLKEYDFDYVRIGEHIKIEGKFKLYDMPENEGQFDSRQYYLIRGYAGKLQKAKIIAKSYNYSLIREKLALLRNFFVHVYDSFLENEDSGIMQAIILGDKTELDEDVKELYQNAGIAHILSLSGLHIAAVGLCLIKILRKTGIPLLLCDILASLIMISYSILTGMSVSTERALIMFLLGVAANVLGRTYDILSGAAVATVIVLIFNPYYILDSGFWLSFGAIIGISLVYPALKVIAAPTKAVQSKCMDFTADVSRDNIFKFAKINIFKSIHSVIDGVIVSVSISLTTLPIIASSFYKTSRYSFICNIVVLPLMGVLLAVGFTGIILGSYVLSYTGKVFSGISGFINQICIFNFKIAHVILKAYRFTAGFFSGCSTNTWILGKPKIYQCIIYYVCLGLVVIITYFLQTTKKTKRKTIELILRLVSAFLIVLSTIVLTYHPMTSLELRNISVGQGDCTLISGKDTPVILIDGGSSTVKKTGKYRLIPVLLSNGIGEIDYVFLSHLDSDHTSAVLEVLSDPQSDICIKRVVISDVLAKNCNPDNVLKLDELKSAVEISGAKLCLMNKGDVLENGEISIECIWPDGNECAGESNDDSMVLKLKHKKTKFTALFTGDISSAAEERIISECNLGKVNYLKVAHHGSSSSSCREFLEIASPDIAVISVGKNNSYGHPHAETLERLEYASNARVLRTDESGQVSIIVGENVKVRQFKERNNDDK